MRRLLAYSVTREPGRVGEGTLAEADRSFEDAALALNERCLRLERRYVDLLQADARHDVPMSDRSVCVSVCVCARACVCASCAERLSRAYVLNVHTMIERETTAWR